MAKITEILDIEKDRNEKEKWNVIHLFKEGGFYRAYNWSAWLIVTFSYNDEVRKETKDRKPLAVSRKKMKSTETDFVFVGFPLKSLDKFVPSNIGFTPIADTQIDVTIDLSYNDDVTYGVEFLGGFVKRYRNYVSRHTVKRMIVKLSNKDNGEYEYSDMYCTINSYLGMLGHYSSYKIRQDIFMKDEYLKISSYDCEMSKMHKIAC